jgi:uncharacterized protein with ParB-like and HNH nuclease domain
MSLFEDTNPKALKELLAEISSRAMALPDFQRDFVWEPGATQELIVSIANDYPAGSILRVRDEKRSSPRASSRALLRSTVTSIRSLFLTANSDLPPSIRRFLASESIAISST